MHADAPPPLPIGTTVIRRDVYRGRVWTSYPTRVIEDSPRGLVLAWWPGVRVLVPATWTAWLRGAGEAMREQAIPNLARGNWALEPWTWQTTTWVQVLLPERWFSVSAVLDDEGGRLRHWYVNFQRPYRRSAKSVDTFDLFLDLVVEPDRSLRWKDEGEYRQARRLGVVSAAEARAVDQARQEAEALARAGDWPFADRWASWKRDPGWPLPLLAERGAAPGRHQPAKDGRQAGGGMRAGAGTE